MSLILEACKISTAVVSLILKAFTRDFVRYLTESDTGGIHWRFCKISTAVVGLILKAFTVDFVKHSSESDT